MGWEERVHNKPQHGKYEDYVDAHYGILEVNASRRNINASELLNLEQAILNAKLAFLHDAPQQDWFNLSALDTKTSSLPPGLWLNILRKHDRQFNWTNDDIAIAEDVKIFQSIDKLHKTNGNDKLIIGLSWIFIQTHLWAVTGEPSLRFSDKQDELQTFWERSCMAYVESRLGLLVLPKSFTDYYAKVEHRKYIDSLLKRMRDNAKQLLNNLTWMDGPSKMLAFRKLENMTRVILPAEIFFDRKTRDKLYGLFPEMTGKTFVTNLVETTEIYRKLRRDEHFGDVYSVHLFPQFGLELYLYLANALKLAIGVLNPPLFYKNATLAMSANASSWRSLNVFPFIPGIELAYVSYEAAVGGGYLDLLDYRVIHLEPYSDDQIFFIAYCYALCAHRPQTMADECNVPVKNSPQFAAAYHCPVGSPMNPPNKCTFFY
ncbi:hypothetical protein MRX96_036029 [Rhipicephalus microplus]